MFKVVRWAGPDEGPKRKEGGVLSLHQLNARARQRAESRHLPQSAAGKGGVLGRDAATGDAQNVPDRTKEELGNGGWMLGRDAATGDAQNVHALNIRGRDQTREQLGIGGGVLGTGHAQNVPASKIRVGDRTREELGNGEAVLGRDAAIREGQNVPAAKIRVSEPSREDSVRRELKREKKRKKREGTEEKVIEQVVEPVIPHLGKKEKASKKRKISEAAADGTPELQQVHVEPADESRVHGMLDGQNLVDSEIPSKEKKKKRKEKKKSALPDCDKQSDSLENVEEPVPTLEVSGSPLPAVSLDSCAVNNFKTQEVSERADVVAAVQTVKEKRRKKGKTVRDESEAQGNETDTGDHLLLDSRAESSRGNVPADEVDLSRIERDVEKILGHDLLLSKAAGSAREKGPALLPWMREPREIGSHKVLPLNEVPGLDVRLQEALRKSGVEALFPVQVAVWHETVGPGGCERDLCVCSPTGSGKTLSYALPIVQKLSTRVIRRLRALVVLPTRDLAGQVKAVFDTIAPSVGLAVGLAVGQTSISAEAAELVKFRQHMVHSFGGSEASDHANAESCVDILVATPGRLMDHLHNTKEFTLQHLYYLVVDETDRLLRQSYQDWLPNVLSAVAATESSSSYMLPSPVFNRSTVRSVRTIRYPGLQRGMRGTVYPRLMKMVLSATLTRDPSKIAQLALHSPMYIAQSATDKRYQLPEQLLSFKLVCKLGEKPLYLAALLQQLVGQQTIVFTASVVATHRLFTLLSSFEGLSFKAVEYSSFQHQQARSKSLLKFRDGEAQVLVASDAMTRGMDVEGVENVVNYDMPVYAKTYVHRVGRTARAGRAGCSYTLLRREEARHFKILLKKADNSSCQDYRLPASATEKLYDGYLTALEKLKEVSREESSGAPAPVLAGKGGRVVTLRGQQEVSGADELFM